MTEVEEEGAYIEIDQPTVDGSYVQNIHSTTSQGDVPAQNVPKAHQEPETTPEFIYLGDQEPSAPSAPVIEQPLQTTPSPYPPTVPHNETFNSYPQTTPAPIPFQQGYVPQQQPPSYNDLYGKGHPNVHPGLYTNQPQPWNQQFQPNYQGNVVVTTQPQPMPNNVVMVSSVQQRNDSQGLAIASLVMAIVGIFCCFCTICCSIPGIVFAAISLGNSTDAEKAKEHAKTSMICTATAWICGFGILVIYIILVFVV